MNGLSAESLNNFVLIVDSQADTTELIQALSASRQGVSVREGKDIDEALKLLQEGMPDCLILDLDRPERHGVQLLERLRQTYGGVPCPVVVVTGEGSERVATGVLQAGAHDYISRERVCEPQLWEAIRYARTRHELRRELEQLNVELTRKDRIKTEFVASATHELRTPLTAIVGLIELLQEEHISQRARTLVATMSACCDALLLCVDDVLDLTKIEAGEFVLYPSRFHPDQNLQVVVDSLQPIALDKGVELIAESPPEMAEVTGDARRTRQLLYNLASNALKFTRQGKVVLRVHPVEERDGILRLRYEVEDTGIGIAPEEQARVFQRNYQSGGGHLRSKGTGLGLAIVEGITRRMGGSVGLQSTLGKGSTFWFEIPFALTSNRCDRDPASSPPSCPRERSLRILVAEDNPIIARVMDRQLKNLGHTPTLAYDGVEALAATQEQTFDLALLDARMPRLDGLSVASELRKRYSAKDMPIILLTAESQIEREVWVEAGIDECLVKPATPDILRSVLAQHSSGS